MYTSTHAQEKKQYHTDTQNKENKSQIPQMVWITSLAKMWGSSEIWNPC